MPDPYKTFFVKNASAISLVSFLLIVLSCNEGKVREEEKKSAERIPREVSELFDFGKISPEEIAVSTDKAIENANLHLEKLLNEKQRDFNNTMVEFDRVHYAVNRILHPMELVIEAFPDELVRKAAEMADEKLKAYKFGLEVNEAVYNALKTYSETDEAKSLGGFKKKFVDDQLLKYELNGMSLPPEKRNEIKSIKGHIDRLGTSFRTNIGASDGFLEITKKDTAGMDSDFLQARKTGKGTYKLDLSYPTNNGVMTYALSTEVRKNYSQHFYNRGMPDNVSILDSILYYRHQLATMLGYSNYAEYAVATRMAKTPEKVWEFENSLIEQLQDKAKFDYDQLLAVKSQYTGKEETVVEEWEVAFFINILKKTQYDLDEQALSEYFEVNQVIAGLFEVTQKMFGLKYEEVKNPSLWHEEVRMFNCYDSKSNELVGRFYLDLFPRENKYSHAAMFTIHGGVLNENGAYLVPEAALVCNFPRAEGDKPALLKHSNVRTFFHEFGHLIHGLTTNAELSLQANLESVVLDFIEAPSQLYENWVYEKEVLSLFAKHYETGEIIPDELLEKIVKARHLYSGLSALRQCFYGSFDFSVHDKYVPYKGETTYDMAKKMRKDIMWFDVMENTSFQASFGHLIGYGSGYYSYMWSKVYAQDMWSVFAKEGVLNPEVGKAYREKVLAPAASVDAMDLVTNFLGRKPNNKALLLELGVAEK